MDIEHFDVSRLGAQNEILCARLYSKIQLKRDITKNYQKLPQE